MENVLLGLVALIIILFVALLCWCVVVAVAERISLAVRRSKARYLYQAVKDLRACVDSILDDPRIKAKGSELKTMKYRIFNDFMIAQENRVAVLNDSEPVYYFGKKIFNIIIVKSSVPRFTGDWGISYIDPTPVGQRFEQVSTYTRSIERDLGSSRIKMLDLQSTLCDVNDQIAQISDGDNKEVFVLSKLESIQSRIDHTCIEQVLRDGVMISVEYWLPTGLTRSEIPLKDLEKSLASGEE